MHLLGAVLLLLAIAESQAQQDTKLCPYLTDSGLLPALPPKWVVEFKYSYWQGLGAKSHEEGFEAFDATKKRSGYIFAIDGEFSQTYQHVADFANKKSYRIHYFIPYNEKDACTTVDLVNSHLPVADYMTNGEAPVGPTGVMYLTGNALNPGLIGAELVPSDHLYRNLLPTIYRGCYYDEAKQETLQFYWYYINQPGTKNMIPLGAKVTIKRPESDDYFYLRYDFVSFDPDERAFLKIIEDTNVFEIPSLYSCNINPGLKTFPDVSHLNVQTYSIEYVTLDPVYSWLKQQLEKYNYNRRYWEEKDNVQVNRTLFPLTRMGDYSTGVRYNIDRYLGTCAITPLNIGLDSAAVVHSDGLCMKNPSQSFASTLKYTYDGIKTLRGMECHTWTGDTMTSEDKLSQRVQWCFATNDSISGSHPTLDFTPILLILGYNNSETFSMLYQEMFSFKTTNPPLYSYDVSECFRSTTNSSYMMSHYVVQFPLDIAATMSADPILFKTSFIRTVRHVTNVTENRIVNLYVEFSKETVDVTFSLLPPSPVEGALSPTRCPPVYQPSIAEAAGKLYASVRGGSFTVEMRRPFSNETVGKVTAKASESAVYQPPRLTPMVWFTGYSAGVLTGLGVLSTLLGFASGVALYLYVLGPYFAKNPDFLKF